MRQLKELLRLKYIAHLTHRQIAGVLNPSTGVVSKYVQLAEAAHLSYPLPDDIDDTQLQLLLTAPPRSRPPTESPPRRCRHSHCRTLPALIFNSSVKVSPACCSGKSTQKASRRRRMATLSSANSIAAGARNTAQSCAKLIAPVKSSFSITAARPLPLLTQQPERLEKHKSSSRALAHRTAVLQTLVSRIISSSRLFDNTLKDTIREA